MARLILPYQRVEDLNGHPLPGAQLYFYEPATVALKDTYSDEALTTPNTNPVIADSQGQFGDIFLSGNYSVKLDDADDVTQPDYPAEIEAASDSSSVVLLTGDQTIAGVKTFTDRLAVKADTPTYELEENDGSADNRLWQFVAVAEQFIFRVANDVRGVFASIFTVDRTGTTVDTVNFLPTNLQQNGTKVLIQTDILDEDDMASDSATKAPSQQSTKAYVDATTGLQKIVDIGEWDMDTDSSTTVAHGLTQSNIRSVKAIIRNDAGSTLYDLSRTPTGDSAVDGGINIITSINVDLSRATGRTFDGVNYDLTEYNINNAAAVDKGSGLVGIPITAHTFSANDVTTIAGSVNYNATYTIVSETTNEIVVTATYAAETFAGTETASWSRGWITIGYIT